MIQTLTLQTSLILGGFSYHVNNPDYTYEGQTHRHNEVNPAIGIEGENWGITQFQNSFYKPSLMQTYTWSDYYNDWYYGATLGAIVYGYQDTPQHKYILPMGQLEGGYRTGPVTTVVGIVPSLSTPLLTLHWKYAF